MSRAWFAVLALVSSGVLPAHATATESPGDAKKPIFLRISACEAARVSVSHLVELLNAEVAPQHFELLGESQAEPTRGDVTLCYSKPSDALLRVFRDGLEISQRNVDLSDVEGDGRARTLAAIIAEMWVAPRQPPDETVTPEPRASVKQEVPSPSGFVHISGGSVRPFDSGNRARTHWHSGAALFMREYSGAGNPFYGMEVHLGYGLFEADASLGRSQVAAHSGTIDHSFAVFATTFELERFFTGPELVPRLRFETGVAWTQSHANDNRTTTNSRTAVLSAAMFELLLRQRMTAHSAGELKVAGGYSGGLTAAEDGTPRSSTSGWVAGIGVGLTFH